MIAAPGWEEIADQVITWVEEHVPPSRPTEEAAEAVKREEVTPRTR